jgi:predicted Zn-dependent peptidase
MSLESSGARAEQMARHLLSYGRVLTPTELVTSVDAVDSDRVRDLARDMVGRPPSTVIVGSGKKSSADAAAAHAVVTGLSNRPAGDVGAATRI